MKYLHRPNHPQADEFGMVEASVAGVGYTGIPAIISDHMEPTKHMGTGRIHDSKSEFRKDTKAVGCIEIGNEQLKPREPIRLDKRKRAEDIRRTIYELKNGRYG